MDILKFGYHTSNQTNPTQTPAGVIKISDKEARDRSTIPYIDPNPVPFTTLRLSTPAPSSGPGGTPFIDDSISQQEAIEKAQLFLTRKADSIVEKAQTPPREISMTSFHYHHIIGLTQTIQWADIF
jgi:hypothetical protein